VISILHKQISFNCFQLTFFSHLHPALDILLSSQSQINYLDLNLEDNSTEHDSTTCNPYPQFNFHLIDRLLHKFIRVIFIHLVFESSLFLFQHFFFIIIIFYFFIRFKLYRFFESLKKLSNSPTSNKAFS
jgi:hypothetical protein